MYRRLVASLMTIAPFVFISTRAEAQHAVSFNAGYFAVRGEDARATDDVLVENRNLLAFEFRDFNNVALKIRAQNPDVVVPANYYNEYVLLARTMQQQRVRPKAIYSVLGGAASSYKFVKEFPEAAQYIMDCNHWFDPRNPKALALKKKVEDQGQFYTYEVYMNYSCILLVADALERAAWGVLQVANASNVTVTSLSITGPDASRQVGVTVTAEFNWIFPGVFNLFGANFTNPMSLTGQAVMRNEGSS